MADKTEIGAGLGGAAGDFIGTLIGEAMAQGDYETARKLRASQRARLEGIATPDIKELGDTAYAGIGIDPRYGNVEDEVLNRLMSDSKSGMDAQDEADLARGRREAQQQEQASQAALESLARRRGTYSSGLTTAAQLASQQGQANRLNIAGVEAAGQAAGRRRTSLNAAGSYASTLAGRKLGMDTRTAGARDDISRMNQQLPQQRYANEMGKARSINEVDAGEAQDALARAERTKRLARGASAGGGSILGFGMGSI